MYNLSNKYKRILFYILKLCIVFAAVAFIYQKLSANQSLSFLALQERISQLFSHNFWALIGILLLTDINWLLEITKWKVLVSVVKKISFMEAYEQSLGAHTVAVITPNRIGEYGAKAIFYGKEHRKKILVLNFLGNMSQLLATLLFGSIGLGFILEQFHIRFPELDFTKILISTVIIGILILLFYKFVIQKLNFFLKKFTVFLKGIPNIVYKNTIGLSCVRFLIFSHQFYFLLLLFGAENDYFTTMSLIFSTYLLASIIPSFAIFDWAIKGSVAVWLFQLIGLDELTVLTVTTLMWILNFAIPALIGSIFVLNFKVPEK